MGLSNEHTTIEHADSVTVSFVSPRYTCSDAFWLAWAATCGVGCAVGLFHIIMAMIRHAISLATGAP